MPANRNTNRHFGKHHVEDPQLVKLYKNTVQLNPHQIENITHLCHLGCDERIWCSIEDASL